VPRSPGPVGSPATSGTSGAMGPAGHRDPVEVRLASAGLPPLARTAWLEIDVDALRGNLDSLRATAGPGVRVEPVVKADAYGHGAVPIALALQAAGVDSLSVATLDEAFELRDGGVTLPILVLYPIPAGCVAEAAAARIAASLGPGALGARTLAEAAAHAAAGGDPLEVHVEVETGLGRGGMLPQDAASHVDAVRRSPGVRLGGVWTHLAAAEDAAYSGTQDALFGGVVASLASFDEVAPVAGTAGAAVRLHLAGSGGLLGGNVRRWDAVRAGIALYGLVPDGMVSDASVAASSAGLRPVMELRARAVRVLDLPVGHGVSYGPVFVTSRPSRIATLPVGYGDGWRRVLSDRASALVRGVRVPLVGRVAMDAVMADVTDVPGAPVTEEDEFVLLGAQGDLRITAHDLASACGTISYEVVTGMSRRLARVYHAAGSVVGMRTLTGGKPE
jgi:alanine racemase